MPNNRGRGNNAKNMLKNVNVENVIIVVLVIVLVGLVGYYVYNNNKEGFKSEKPVVVLYYADWCPHCTRAKPVLEALKKNNNKVDVQLVDCEANKEEARKQNIRAYPTVKLHNNGDVVEFNNNVTMENLLKWIEENL